MTRLLILRPGSTDPAVQKDHGDYDRWFTDAMRQEGLSFEVRDLTRGGLPDPGGHDGVIVTGSTSSAYREEPWMPPLADFLKRADTLGIPALCVCFGAQMLAHARGGRVALNPRGWEIGAVSVDLAPAAADDPLFQGLPDSFTALATHEDHIEALPPGAVPLAGNESSPVQAFRAARLLWGVQFHPELSPEALDRLIRLRAGTLARDASRRGLPEEGHVDRLRATLRGPDVLAGRRVLDNFVALCRRSG